MSKLTPRMKNWLVGSGAHVGTASRAGVPTVIVADTVRIEGDEVVAFPLSAAQVEHVRANLAENPQVAFGPGGLGSIRAAYQFKGKARLDGDLLRVEVSEIYSTKPGPEAGLRLDTLPYESVLKFEASRWKDEGPPARAGERS
jgi:predicted pyridoxine 5'-phosphate oxidase superfamily flavin-nucleotide-binding protein